MRSCATNALECEGVVYVCVTVRKIVLLVIASFRVFIAWMVCKFSASILDLLHLEIDSWSSLELIATCVFFGIVSTFFCTTPLEVMTVYFSLPPLEVGVGYLTGSTDYLGMSAVECGDTVGSSVCQFSNIVLTASIDANCELYRLVGTSLSAAYKKCMERVIVSSPVTWGCMRYSCKYSALSVIINALVLLSIAWIQR